jgi:ribose transport system permease protein
VSNLAKSLRTHFVLDGGRLRFTSGIRLPPSLTLIGLLLLLWLALSLSTDNFATVNNFSNLMRQASIWSVIAIGQTFVIITAGIDLSVGAVIGLSSTVVSMLMVQGWPIWSAVLVALVLGVVIGMFHGFAIVQMRLPPFITTLATMTALRGIGLLLTGGQTIAGLPDSFGAFSRGTFLGFPNLFVVVMIVVVPCFIILHHSRIGRYLFSVGSNVEAARLSGVNVGRTIYFAYMMSGGLAALAGIMTASRIGIGIATTGEGSELQSIAAAVIGGASLFGAVGSVIGPLIGAILLTTINNGADLLNVNPFWQRIVTGFLILLIVYFDQLRRKRRA